MDRLRGIDRLVVYVEPPPEGGGYGGATDKVRALDLLDQTVLGPLQEVLWEGFRPFRLVLLAGGAVSCLTGQRLAEAAPVVVMEEGVVPDPGERWDEETCAGGALGSMNLRDFCRTIRDERPWH